MKKQKTKDKATEFLNNFFATPPRKPSSPSVGGELLSNNSSSLASSSSSSSISSSLIATLDNDNNQTLPSPDHEIDLGTPLSVIIQDALTPSDPETSSTSQSSSQSSAPSTPSPNSDPIITTTTTTTTTKKRLKKRRSSALNRENSMDTVGKEFELRITTYNTYWFFDNNDDPEPFRPHIRPMQEKAIDIAQMVSEIAPHILCLQEIKNDVVLAALADALKRNYRLSYKHYWAGNKSLRTDQSIGLLVRDDGKIKVEAHGTFKYEEDNEALAFLNSNERYRNLPEASKKEFLNKTIWLKFTANDMKFLLINLHLKASGDELSRNIRELEGTLVQLMLKNLLESEARNVIIAGDFNDQDEEVLPATNGDVIPNALALTTVVRRIRQCQDYEELKGLQLYNTLNNIPKDAERTSMLSPMLIDLILIDYNLVPLLNKVFIHKPWPPGLTQATLKATSDLVDKGLLASDHWPVTATLSIPAANTNTNASSATHSTNTTNTTTNNSDASNVIVETNST